MIRTGNILKEGREKKQMSIPEVSLATKINPRILQAIEAGNVKDLPSHSYLRGFVRSYASYLRIDVNQVLSTFNDEMGEVQPSKLSKLPPPEVRGTVSGTTESKLPDGAVAEVIQPKTTPPPEQPKEKSKATPAPAAVEYKNPFTASQTKKFTSKTMLAGAAVVLICLIAIVQRVVDKYQRESELPPTPGELAVIEETSTPSTPVVDLPVEAPKPVESAKPVEIAKPVETPKPPPPPVVVPPPAPVVAPAPAPVVATPPAPAVVAPAPLPAAAQVILIEALDSVSLSFKIDNGETRRVTLSPEEVHTIRAKTGVTMDISDGGAVNIVQNGKDRGVPGDLGKPIKVKFP